MKKIDMSIRDGALRKKEVRQSLTQVRREQSGESTHDITDNSRDSGVMRGKSFRLLHVSGKQVLRIEKISYF